MRRCRPSRPKALALALTLAGCAGSAPEAGDARDAPHALGAAPARRLASPAAHAYVLRPAPDLASLEVELCLSGQVPERLVAGRGGGDARIVRAVAREDGRAPRELRVEGGAIETRGLSDGACVEYVARLGPGGLASPRAAGGARVLDSSTWLLRPARRSRDAHATLRVDAPEGISVALPWPRDGDRDLHLLDDSAFRFLSHSIFGRLERYELASHRATLDVVRLPGPLEVDRAGLDRWLEAAGRAVSEIHGRFPVDRVQVAIVPVGSRGEGPVPFGNVGRGGGASIMLLVAEDATADQLVGDWVAVHELCHLAMPFVGREGSWLSEGVATYYQEILRARAGLRSPLEAYRALDRGFLAGARDGTGRSLAEESAHMFETRAFRRVYWGGTALALLYDVALRRRGGEIASLDAALSALDACCAQPPRVWTAAELVATLDRLVGEPLFEELSRPHLASRDAPDLRETYAYLGLARGADGLLGFVDGAPGAPIRDALTRSRLH